MVIKSVYIYMIYKITLLLFACVFFLSERTLDSAFFWSFAIADILVSALSSLLGMRLLFKHRVMLVIPPLLLAAFGSVGIWGGDDLFLKFFILSVIAQFISIFFLCVRFSHYGEKELDMMKKERYSEKIIQSVMSNILERRLYKQLKQKMEPRRASYVANKLATGALSESRASGGALAVDHLTAQAAGLAGAISAVDTGSHFSDDLLSRAMSIADHHIAAFDAGHWQTSGPMGMDTNPATGLPMMGSGIDTGGDAFGSSWNHDHSMSSPSFDSHYSDPFHDSASGINTGSSFDDFNRY